MYNDDNGLGRTYSELNLWNWDMVEERIAIMTVLGWWNHQEGNLCRFLEDDVNGRDWGLGEYE